MLGLHGNKLEAQWQILSSPEFTLNSVSDLSESLKIRVSVPTGGPLHANSTKETVYQPMEALCSLVALLEPGHSRKPGWGDSCTQALRLFGASGQPGEGNSG